MESRLHAFQTPTRGYNELRAMGAILDDPPTYSERRHLEQAKSASDREIDRQRERARLAEAEFEAFKIHATEVLHRKADDKNFCEEFDDVMEEIGLPRRSRPYNVTVAVTIELEITTDGTSARDAEANITTSDVKDALSIATDLDEKIDEWDTRSAEEVD